MICLSFYAYYIAPILGLVEDLSHRAPVFIILACDAASGLRALAQRKAGVRESTAHGKGDVLLAFSLPSLITTIIEFNGWCENLLIVHLSNRNIVKFANWCLLLRPVPDLLKHCLNLLYSSWGRQALSEGIICC